MEKDIVKASEVSGFATQILRISIEGKEVDVVIKEIQRHPATSRVLHADFMRVDPDSKITLVVPIRTLNDENCVGVKASGGQVNHLINDVEISCLASNLPEQLEIDVLELDIGDTVSLSEIKLPEGVEITLLAQAEDRDQAVVSITEAREMIIEEEEVEGKSTKDDKGKNRGYYRKHKWMAWQGLDVEDMGFKGDTNQDDGAYIGQLVAWILVLLFSIAFCVIMVRIYVKDRDEKSDGGVNVMDE